MVWWLLGPGRGGENLLFNEYAVQTGKIKSTGDMFPNTTELVYLKMVMMEILCIFYHN